MILIMTISTCLFYIYFYTYNYVRLGEHTMVHWKLLEGGPSDRDPSLGFLSLCGVVPWVAILVSIPRVLGK
jgi:hypothetical protein